MHLHAPLPPLPPLPLLPPEANRLRVCVPL
jgi:hypothetical protein